MGRIAVTAHSLNGQWLATAFVDLPMKCDPAAIADLFTSVGRSGVCDDFATLFNAEQTSGAAPTWVTQFFGFLERSKQRWIGLGVELCGDMDYLVLCIAKHCIFLKKVRLVLGLPLGVSVKMLLYMCSIKLQRFSLWL